MREQEGEGCGRDSDSLVLLVELKRRCDAGS